MAYATLTDLKDYLNVTGGQDDWVLTRLLAQAQTVIEERTGRVFEAGADVTRKFDALGDVDELTLYVDADLCQITTISNGNGVTVTSGQYVTEPRNTPPFYAIRLKSSSGVVWTYTNNSENAISVTGRWAWSVVAPNDIVWATVRLAAWMYRQRDNSGGDQDRPVMVNTGAVLLPSRLPTDIYTVIEGYKRHSLSNTKRL